MALSIGIVGLPNVGKSTLFNALNGGAGAEAANYPFCTIDPNVGVVPVPDPRLAELAAIVHPQQIRPATVEFNDIAGLVAGASKGEGLGNRFLAHIRECAAVAHVVRCFEDDDVSHVAAAVDPLRDIATVETELMLKDLETVERVRERVEKQAKSGDGEARKSLVLLDRVLAALGEGRPVRRLSLDEEERTRLRGLHLLTAKPVLYVANVSEEELAGEGGDHLRAVECHAAGEGAAVVAVSAAIEAELAGMDAAARTEFLEELGLSEPGLDRLVREAYRLLDLITFFTAGPKEVRAWTIPRGATAPEAAGTIHTDFARGFIRAEVVAYDDFVSCGGEQGAREAGKMRLEGKSYVVQEGDVVHFRFNV
ncbi:MAG: redox-regulated ATPase YchF [Zetaproteobacteria bacterium]|nr:MAG: redox-regulated ATPase YchF [Zetaproteobacteria bacterium]